MKFVIILALLWSRCAASNLCFQSKRELNTAVWKFYNDGCSDNYNCKNDIVQIYGWPMGSWCVSEVTDMSELFRRSFDNVFKKQYAMPDFNDDISSWDVSSVTSMAFMFQGAASFNQDLSLWNVSSVKDLSYMFDGASSFNQDLSCWNVTQVVDMRKMFSDAKAFNQDLCTWGVMAGRGVESDDIFLGSGCEFTQNPIWRAGWAFCGDQCVNYDTKTLVQYIRRVCEPRPETETASGVASYLKRSFIIATGLFTLVASI